MSAIILLPIILPAAASAFPALLTAAGAAAAALGYAAARGKSRVQGGTEVSLEVDRSCEVIADLALGETAVFVKGDVQVVFGRDTKGKAAVKVVGKGKSEDELRAIGEQFARAVVQQYAYHRLMTELKQRNFHVVAEEVEEDGTVRLQVRAYQG
ncbi:MAG: DUF1257 domain-containing protein [Planctomycetota bacterium]|nr:DUF1257 domain-containing protein [Planctomycetota bacterium]